MKFKGHIIVGFFTLLSISTPLCAKTALPNTQGYVSDYARVLSPNEVSMLNAQSAQLKHLTGAEVATLIVNEMGDNWTIESYATAVFEKWKIGEVGKDNGVLLVMALQDRKIRIEVGYGLEGILPDGKTGKLLDTYVLPRFKTGDISTGIQAGHIALTQEIATAYNVQLSAPATGQTVQVEVLSTGGSIFVSLFLGLFIFGLIKSRTFRNIVLAMLITNILGGGRNHRGGGHFGGGGGFGGFGGGMSGGGGSSRGW